MIQCETQVCFREDLSFHFQDISFEKVTYDCLNTKSRDSIQNACVMIFVDTDGQSKILKNRYGKPDSVYSKETIRKSIRQLLDQIDYLQTQYIKCREYILSSWWEKSSKNKFIKQTFEDDDNSNTLIFNLSKLAREDPEAFKFVKEFYNKKSPTNN